MLKSLKIFGNIFALGCILFIPFPFHLWSFQGKITELLFGNAIQSVKPFLFQTIRYKEITSDSTSLYTLVFLLFIGSLMSTIMLLLLKSSQRYVPKFLQVIHILIIYYLSMQLFVYGFAKVFKGQFYIPEPNILFTPVGFLDKDILYWSVMGTSYSYNLYMGMVEVFAGIMLIFGKTRLLGLFLSLGIFVNIVAINFSFDISVKVYSSILLILTVIAFAKYKSSLKKAFFSISIAKNVWEKGFWYSFLKTFVVLLILFEALYPNLATWTFNDDQLKRPLLHGVYLVKDYQKDGESIATPIKRIFFHRRQYFITQGMDDEFQDYQLKINPITHQLLLTDYQQKQSLMEYSILAQDSLLTLRYQAKGSVYQIISKKLDEGKLPISTPLFHWTIDKIE